MSVSRHTKKIVRFTSMLAVALIASRAGGVAAGEITVEPQCPSSISPGAPLSVELRLTNKTQTVTYNLNGTPFVSSTGKPFVIAKSALIAHVGNLNVLGPYVIPIALTLDPQPAITVSPNSIINPPATPQSFTTTGYLNVAFPTSAPGGTFTDIIIDVLDQANKTLGRGACRIEVN